jgi:hypothetical protein
MHCRQRVADNFCRHVESEQKRALQLRWDSKVPGFANLRDNAVTTWYSNLYPAQPGHAWDKDEALSSEAVAVRTFRRQGCRQCVAELLQPVHCDAYVPASPDGLSHPFHVLIDGEKRAPWSPSISFVILLATFPVTNVF